METKKMKHSALAEYEQEDKQTEMKDQVGAFYNNVYLEFCSTEINAKISKNCWIDVVGKEKIAHACDAAKIAYEHINDCLGETTEKWKAIKGNPKQYYDCFDDGLAWLMKAKAVYSEDQIKEWVVEHLQTGVFASNKAIHDFEIR